MDEKGVRLQKPNGEFGPVVNFWRAVREHAERLLGDDVAAGRDYALTEVVHCKSKKEIGVQNALATCSDLYLSRVIEQSEASLLIVLGRPARMAFRTVFKFDDTAALSEPMDIAGRVRRVAFMGAPSSTSGKYPRYLSGEDLGVARAWLSYAN